MFEVSRENLKTLASNFSLKQSEEVVPQYRACLVCLRSWVQFLAQGGHKKAELNRPVQQLGYKIQ